MLDMPSLKPTMEKMKKTVLGPFTRAVLRHSEEHHIVLNERYSRMISWMSYSGSLISSTTTAAKARSYRRR